MDFIKDPNKTISTSNHSMPGELELPKQDQTIKQDDGKDKLSLVPIEAMWHNIAKVREFGIQKYEENGWKSVQVRRLYDAFYRHVAAMLNDPHAIDTESGLPHSWHAACNLAFIFELERNESK